MKIMNPDSKNEDQPEETLDTQDAESTEEAMDTEGAGEEVRPEGIEETEASQDVDAEDAEGAEDAEDSGESEDSSSDVKSALITEKKPRRTVGRKKDHLSFKERAQLAKEKEEAGETDSEIDQQLEEYIKLKRKKKAKKEEEKEVEAEKEEVEIVEEEEQEAIGYTVKLKPELDDETREALKLREKQRKSQPSFKRQEWFRYKRLGENWRRPRGLHSKARRNMKYRPPRARVGYRKVKLARGLHPSGFEDILVFNLKELQALDPKTQAARIGGSVGDRKRKELQEYAEEHNIRVLNRKEAKK